VINLNRAQRKLDHIHYAIRSTQDGNNGLSDIRFVQGIYTLRVMQIEPYIHLLKGGCRVFYMICSLDYVATFLSNLQETFKLLFVSFP
jgi:hypothetical protein